MLGPLGVLAVGLGQIFVATSVLAIAGVDSTESGLASALLNVGRQLGGSLGIAIMGAIAGTVTRNQLTNVVPTHAAIDTALTAGFGSAFEFGGLVAVAGFFIALVAVRGRARAAVAEEVAAAA